MTEVDCGCGKMVTFIVIPALRNSYPRVEVYHGSEFLDGWSVDFKDEFKPASSAYWFMLKVSRALSVRGSICGKWWDTACFLQSQLVTENGE